VNKISCQKRFVLGVAVFLLIFILGACQTGKIETEQKNALSYGLEELPSAEKPAEATKTQDISFFQAVLQGLFVYDENGNLQQQSVAEWNISEDGLTYTLILKDDIYWSDGEQLQAEEYVQAWLDALNPEQPSLYVYEFYPIKNALDYALKQRSDFIGNAANLEDVGIRAIDEKTIEITLEERRSDFLHSLAGVAFLPLPIREGELSYGNFLGGELPVNGAYIPMDYLPEKELFLKLNPDFSGAIKPEIEEYHLLIPGNDADIRKAKDGNARIVRNSLYYYSLNTFRGPLENESLRRALDFALDRRDLAERISPANLLPAFGLLPETIGNDGFQHTSKTDRGEEALELLHASGYAAEDKPLRLWVLDSPEELRIAEEITTQWKKSLGIEIEISAKDLDSLLKAGIDDFDIWANHYQANVRDPLVFLELFENPVWRLQNKSFWQNGAYDSLLREIKSLPEGAARDAKVLAAEKILSEELPFLPLFSPTESYAVPRNYLVREHPGGGLDLVLIAKKTQ